MTDWAIGDIQGCAEPFFRLLQTINFNADTDTLWVAGDMINRGPDNLSVLRYIKGLGEKARVVLGNHDLHCLATVAGARKLSPKDTLHDVINAPDSEDLLHWLRQQPLMQMNTRYLMTHAGIPHIWNTEQAWQLANEVSNCLKSDITCQSFLMNMYGNDPSCWSESLTGEPRLRTITNYFTRMRFINAAGDLNLTAKEGAKSAPAGFSPWFAHHASRRHDILFGHWAALNGTADATNVHALDTGCVWGGSLTAMNLENQVRVSVPANI